MMRLRFQRRRAHRVPVEKRPLFKSHEDLIKAVESEFKLFFDRKFEWICRHPFFADIAPVPLEQILNPYSTVLVLSPHPDDELIGCGGTLIKLKRQNSRITVVQLTEGSASQGLSGASKEKKQTVRLQEAVAVARQLKFDDLHLWALPDSKFEVTAELIDRMATLLGDEKPDAIFVPFLNDIHSDHVKANLLLAQALRQAEITNPMIFSYETWAFVPLNCISDTSATFDDKADALLLYPTAVRVVDYIHMCEYRDAYHHMKHFGTAGYAEAFFASSVTDYIDLVQSEVSRSDEDA